MEASKTKTILRLPDLEHARTAGLNSLTSRDAELRTASGRQTKGQAASHAMASAIARVFSDSRKRQLRMSGSKRRCGNGSKAELVKHRLTKESGTDRLHLNHRATPRLTTNRLCSGNQLLQRPLKLGEVAGAKHLNASVVVTVEPGHRSGATCRLSILRRVKP
jgi:hypothetical protein